MAGAMAMMQQAAAANQANTSKDGGSESAVTLDSELDEPQVLIDLSPSTKIKYHCLHNLQQVICSKENNCTRERQDSMVPPGRILKFSFEKLSWSRQGGC